DLGALEIARGRVAPSFALTAPVAQDQYLFPVTAGAFFEAVDAHGPAPALSPAELRAGTPEQRSAADHVLIGAYALRLARVPGRPASDCARSGAGVEATLPRAAVVVTNLRPQPIVLTLRRFGDAQRPVPFAFLVARSTARLTIPVDRVALPWRLSANLPASIAVCRG
ncbi:MAG: hypothetical protein QOG11_781, partial [Solirubrobacteraceae bacterium]|nr:hypothetical protein [Solirubrobacteraceae bacterium]